MCQKAAWRLLTHKRLSFVYDEHETICAFEEFAKIIEYSRICAKKNHVFGMYTVFPTVSGFCDKDCVVFEFRPFASYFNHRFWKCLSTICRVFNYVIHNLFLVNISVKSCNVVAKKNLCLEFEN